MLYPRPCSVIAALAPLWKPEAELRAEIERLNGIISGMFPETAALHELLDRAGCVSMRKDDVAALRARNAELVAALEGVLDRLPAPQFLSDHDDIAQSTFNQIKRLVEQSLAASQKGGAK